MNHFLANGDTLEKLNERMSRKAPRVQRLILIPKVKDGKVIGSRKIQLGNMESTLLSTTIRQRISPLLSTNFPKVKEYCRSGIFRLEADVRKMISSPTSYELVMEADFANFFDTVPLSGVKRMVQSLTNEQEAAQINSLLDQ
jgi:hypothetical protein